jgi:membrane protein implicated in regulation of membrane protease activity
MPDWGWWLLGGLVLLGIEALTLDLLFASFALGAVVGAVAAAFNAPVIVQVLAAVATSLASLFVLRPLALRTLRTEHSQTNVDALIGAPALVMERVDARTGRVKVGGEIWSARTRRPGTEFTAGTDLVVVAIEGATAVVDAPVTESTEPATGSTGE